MNIPVLRLLNIRSSEVWLVRNLFFLQLFQSIGIAMLYTLSNALFLAQFKVDELPKVYMLSGVVLLIFNYIYTKLEHHIQIQRLIVYILLLSALSILAIRLLIYSVEYAYAPVLLLIWYQVIYLCCGNSFWGLASLLFDVRESKRTFSILSSGDSPAKLLGYVSISVFAATIGTSNLIFISALCFLISFLFMRNIIRSNKLNFHELAHKTSHTEVLRVQSSPGVAEMLKSFFGNKLILLISVLSFIVVLSLTVIDFTFLSEVKSKYHDDITLAAFLGGFLSVGRVFAILAKITLTSRIEGKLGIRRTLLVLPLLLIAFTVFILVSERLEGNLTFYLYIFGTMVVLTEVLKSVLQDPLILVLFQPLKPALRLKGHLISKGILAPLGLLFAGVFISLNIWMIGGMYISRTSMFLMITSIAWIIVVYLLERQYIASLIESLKTGVFRGNFLLKKDDAVKAVLIDKMKSPKTLEVIYAANTLEKLDEDAFNNQLLQLLDHRNEDVKKFALRKIKDSRVMAAVSKVKSLLEQPIPDDLKIQCMITLSGLHEDDKGLLLEYLDHPHPDIRKETVVTLFTSGDIESIVMAGQKLMAWMSSPDEQDRMHAADVIGRVADKNFYTSLASLINDPSPGVQLRAIEAAGQIKNSKLIPALFERLNQPQLSKAVMLALSSCGEEVMNYFPSEEEIKKASRKTALNYIQVLTRVRGEKAKSFLEKLLMSETAFKHEVIAALKEVSYVAPEHMRKQISERIQHEADAVYSILEYLKHIELPGRTTILHDALITELKASETSIFYMLSFIHDRQKFFRAFENIRSGSKENIANAIEIIDLDVSKKVCAKFIPVIEYLHLKERPSETRTSTAAEVTRQIKSIISNGTISFNTWTKAAAMYTMYGINPRESAKYLENFPVNGEFLLEETRNFVLQKQP